MSQRLEALAARKVLLLAQMQLQRMEVALHMAELRDAVRPASLFGGALAQPAALFAVVNTVAPMFGLRRFARWVRIGSVAFAVFRILRNWRGSPPPSDRGVSQSVAGSGLSPGSGLKV